MTRSALDHPPDHREARKPLEVPQWIVTTIYAFVPAAVVIALALHTFKAANVEVDTTTLGLLALLLLVPIAPHIRRLRAGGVEAEIGPREAQQLQAAAVDLPPPTAQAAPDEQPPGTPTVQDLVVRDPPLGLAKLRIELERELRRIWLAHHPDAKGQPMSAGMMAHQMRNSGVLPPEIAAPLADVLALANRAVHGEYVPADVASDIAQVGIRVLGALKAVE